MRYVIETTDYGITIYSAIQPDYDHELQIALAPNKLVSGIYMMKTPIQDHREEITRADFAVAFNQATNFFSDFLKIRNNG